MTASENKTMRGYNYRQEEGKYFIYKDSKRHKTPRGVEVWADTEELASAIVSELKRNSKSYTSGDSILCYQFTLCDLVSNGKIKSLESELIEMTNYDEMLADPILMLFQSCPAVQPIATFYEGMMPEFIKSQNRSRQLAMLVIKCALGSMVFAQLMIHDIIEHEGNIEENTENFVMATHDYCVEEGICFPIDSIRKYVTTFVFYCTH